MGNKCKCYSLLLVGLVLILATSVMACDAPASGPTPTVTVTVTATPTPAPLPTAQAATSTPAKPIPAPTPTPTPTPTATAPTDETKVHFEQGNIYLKQGAWDKAIAEFTKAIELAPVDPFTYAFRAKAYDKKGERDLAIIDYSKAINLAPYFALASFYRDRGWAFYSKTKYDLAIADFTKVIELEPVAKAYSDRGLVHFVNARKNSVSGAYQLAIADFTTAIKLDPNAEDYVYRGWAYSELGNDDKAIADYTESIKLDPNDADTYNRRGGCYVRKNESGKAIADYSRAIELDPEFYAAYYNRGQQYDYMGLVSEALSDYKKFLMLSSDKERNKIVSQRIQELSTPTPTPALTLPPRSPIPASINISPTSEIPGQPVLVTGSGFFGASEARIVVTYDGAPVLVSGLSANGQGDWSAAFVIPSGQENWSAYIIIPSSPSGTHTVRANSSTIYSNAVIFTVIPGIYQSEGSGAPGSSLDVWGAGFRASETGIKVTWDGAAIATGISANSLGNWSTSFVIPQSVSGSHIIDAMGSVTPTVSAVFTVVPSK